MLLSVYPGAALLPTELAFCWCGAGRLRQVCAGASTGRRGRARRVFIGSSRHGDGTTMPPRAKARRHHGPVLPRSSARSGGCKLHEPRYSQSLEPSSRTRICDVNFYRQSHPASVRVTTAPPSHIIQHRASRVVFQRACFSPLWLGARGDVPAQNLHAPKPKQASASTPCRSPWEGGRRSCPHEEVR